MDGAAEIQRLLAGGLLAILLYFASIVADLLGIVQALATAITWLRTIWAQRKKTAEWSFPLPR